MGKPVIPHLWRYQGLAVNDYSCDLDALDLGHPRLLVTVGMPVTRHPPYRSRRALLTHRAPTSGSDVQLQIGVWMHDTDFWEPSFDQAIHSIPVQLRTLTATTEHFVP